ncbi:MAG: hypothetical protein JJT95_17740, partial [Pararhodobacter sp.]|nr:hypothetical protein [Pararhodobacter sp.]
MRDGIDHPVEFAIDLGQPGFIARTVAGFSHAQRVHVPGIFFGEHRQELILHQVMLKTVQNGGFERIAPDCACIGAGPLVARAGAAEMLLADLHEA